VSSPRVPGFSSAAQRAEQLARLVYELLDAHADADQLARGPSTELLRQAHLHCLQALQRTRREILAQGVRP
jgi:hypothetical protein